MTASVHDEVAGEPRGRERDERGDTLLEILLAMVIIATAGAALLGAFGASFTDAADVKVLTVLNSTLSQYAQTATNQIQLQATSSWLPCASVGDYTALVAKPAIPSGYTVAITGVSYFNGNTFVSACPSGQFVHTQLVTITATGPNCANFSAPPRCLSRSLSFPVSWYGYSGVQTPTLSTSSTSLASSTPSLANFSVQSAAWPVPSITLATCFNQAGASCASQFTVVDDHNGVANVTPSASLDLGTYTLTFLADNKAGAAKTLAVTFVVNETTAISLAASPASTTYATPVTLTATVTPAAIGAIRPSVNLGSVSFTAGGVPIANCTGVTVSSAGVAACTTSTLSVGSDAVAATYTADSGGLFVAPTAPAAGTVVVTPSPTVTGLAVVSGTTTVAGGTTGNFTYPQTVTLTATVAPAPDGGTVTITSAGNSIAGCSGLSVTGSTATCTITTPASYSMLMATYAGDTDYLGSNSPSSTQAPSVVLNKIATTTTVTSSAAATYPSTMTLTATVAAASGTPTGAVTFTSGSTTLACRAAVSVTGATPTNGRATVTVSAAQASTLSAGMALQTTSGGFVAGATITNVGTTSFTMNQLASGVSPSPTFTFVQPTNSSAAGSNVALSGGKATCLLFGASSYGKVTATYGGDANDLGSTGTTASTLTIAQQAAPTMAAPTIGPSSGTYGSTAWTLTTSAGTTVGEASGNDVVFQVSGTTVPCSSTSVQSSTSKTTFTCTTLYVPVGAQVTATYDGTTNVLASAKSSNLNVTEVKTSQTAVATMATALVSGHTYTLTATVSPFSVFDTAMRISISTKATPSVTLCTDLKPSALGIFTCQYTFTGTAIGKSQTITASITTASGNLPNPFTSVTTATITSA